MRNLPSLIGSRFSKRLDSSLANSIHASNNHLHRERNTLVVLGCLAEKLGLFTLYPLSFTYSDLFFFLQLDQPVLRC